MGRFWDRLSRMHMPRKELEAHTARKHTCSISEQQEGAMQAFKEITRACQ
jgi:hypothetical protein